MDHPTLYPDDLAPGHALGLGNLDATHEKILAAFAQDPEHAQTLADHPWAGAVLLEEARAHVQAATEPLYDFDLAFNYWNWIYHFALYGREYAFAWDRLETMLYPCVDDEMLNAFCLTQGFSFIENGPELVEIWQPLLPELLDQLEISGVRVICNHATWMSQGILIILFYHALQKYCLDHPDEQPRVDRLGLFKPLELGKKVHTLLGPWITTLGHKLNADISDLTALDGVQAMSNVVKVFPDTPSGRFSCCPKRWQAETRKALRFLRQLEVTPGNLIFETPSGGQDAQSGGKLIPGFMPKAAIRLARSRPNQIILVGMDERAIFDRGVVEEGSFSGGVMGTGSVGFALKSLIGQRPENSAASWPFSDWTEMESAIADLITDCSGNKIGQQAVQS